MDWRDLADSAFALRDVQQDSIDVAGTFRNRVHLRAFDAALEGFARAEGRRSEALRYAMRNWIGETYNGER